MPQIAERYSDDTTAYAALLQDINNEYRYLPREALERVSEKLEIPLSQLFSLATFYKSFNLVPRGKHEIHVCMGTACHVRGSQRILERIAHKLQVKPGGYYTGWGIHPGNGKLRGCLCLGSFGNHRR
ncbi:MAG: NAD(P)H-dependent oxidoreductase subunit E [Bacillota bacterium]|nr:NAD(P)H-dependent oxidoreductase subunit E [Bacillota bacterium]